MWKRLRVVFLTLSVKDYCDGLLDEYARKLEGNELGRCSFSQLYSYMFFAPKVLGVECMFEKH